jgi:uncharacterized membrane protein YsdA (DUF1294 family)
MRPDAAHGAIALAAVLGGMLAFLYALSLSATWPALLAGWILAANLTAFAYYGYDKSQARRDGRRVPEVVLHGLALLGGTLGAYAGMRVFRHKTAKGPFLIIFWTVAVLQAVLAVTAAWRLAHG